LFPDLQTTFGMTRSKKHFSPTKRLSEWSISKVVFR